MCRQLSLTAVAALLLVSSAFTVLGAPVTPAKGHDIRQVDFLNHSFPSQLCAKTWFDGVSQLGLKAGKLENKESYSRIAKEGIVYGDLTGDGREEAAVALACGGLAGNYSNYEIFVYGFQSGRESLLAVLDNEALSSDYLHIYPDGILWGQQSISISQGQLVLAYFADGSHAGPAYIVTMKYRLNGPHLVLTGQPERRKTGY